MDITLITSVITLGSLGLLFGVGLAVAAKKFYVKVDPKVEQINEILPGANCGACGHPGCSAYANAVAAGQVAANKCTPGGSEVSDQVAKIMGLEAVAAEDPMVVVVQCQGGYKEAAEKFHYEGLPDCSAAALIGGGHKACSYGCLGHGSCEKDCPFDAITMSANGLPVIDEEKCTACGVCVVTCPRDILKLIPQIQ